MTQPRNMAWALFVFISAGIASFAQEVPETPSHNAANKGTQSNRGFGTIPLVFEQNQGQTDPQVRFLFRGRGYTAFLTSGSMVLSLRPTKAAPGEALAANAQAVSIQFELASAAKNPAIIGEDPQPGRVNYFIGNDPAKWRTNVPTYTRVRYKNVYRGIDLVYYGNHQQLEYDFAISPGADAGLIQFEIKGAKQIRLDTEGSLVVQTGGGDLRFQSPMVYQESHGLRVPVRGTYILKDATHVGFKVAPYNVSERLVIDPVLVYSTYLGGTGNDQASGIAVDSTGAVYIAGYTDSTDFPLATLGSLPAGNTHVFVAKLDPTGSHLIYADYLGGDSQDYGYALALDGGNNVFVTGSTASSDFPMVTPFQGTYPGSFNAFLTKISADGSSLLYSTYLGGNGSDVPAGIAIDASSDVFVAGNTSSTNFPVANAYQSTASANGGGFFGNYGFLSKFSPDGSSLIYSTYLSGNSNVPLNCGGTPCWPAPYSAINGMVLDGNGNAYATGLTNTYNFPTTPGVYLSANSTLQNAFVGFVSKVSSVGGLDYSTYFYESSGNLTVPNAIAVDGSGSAYITGEAYSDGTFPITTTAICDPGVQGWACGYGFITKFDPAGSTLLYSTFLGPNNYARPVAIALDANMNAYVAASTSSSSFTDVNGIEPYGGGSDILLSEIDPSASTQVFATYLGASTDESPASLALDSNGNLYVAGSTDSTDFPVTQGAFQNLLAGNSDAFVLKVGPTSAPASSLSPWSLQYSAQALGLTSQPQVVLLRNLGSAPLVISSITPGRDFAETDTCGSSVPAASSCTFSVTFTPTAVGSLVESISIADDAAGSPHVINLSGIGSGAVAALAPASLTFSAQQVATTSAAQTVTLANTGNANLSISNVQVTGDFGLINTCPATLAVSASCTVNITFTPAASGSRTGSLTFSDNAAGSPQAVSLAGTGTAPPAPIATVTPTSLTFLAQQVGTFSAAQAVTLTNTGNATLNIGNIQAAGDYAQANTCSATLAASSSCTVNITFHPTASGTRSGTLTFSDNAVGSPQIVSLAGVGSVASPPIATVTPANLVFSAQQVGTTSAAQAVTLTNTGSATLNVSSIQVSGDYAQVNNCPATLSINSSCTLNVTFHPTASGTRTGTLAIADNAAGSPQVVNLSGAGMIASLPVATVTPASLAFSAQQVGTTSASQIVMLTNTGNATLNISSVQVKGDYAQINNCPATLSINASCTLNVTFHPTASGTRTGTLAIADNAAGSPQTVNLSGTGTPIPIPIATLTPASLVFSAQPVGTSSPVQAVTLTNTGNASLSVSKIQVAGDYAQTNACPATLAASSSCTINITFTPTASGTRSGTLTASDNAAGSPQTVSLTGTGADFGLTTSSSSDTLKAGATASYQLAVSPVSGAFAGLVKLSCSGAPALTTCTVSPGSVTPNNSPAAATLTITTTASVALAKGSYPVQNHPIYATWIQLQGIGLFGLIMLSSRKRLRKAGVIPLLVLVIATLMFMSGCAGGTGIVTPPSSGTAPGTYKITVTGSSGTLQHALPVTLIVQ